MKLVIVCLKQRHLNLKNLTNVLISLINYYRTNIRVMRLDHTLKDKLSVKNIDAFELISSEFTILVMFNKEKVFYLER